MPMTHFLKISAVFIFTMLTIVSCKKKDDNDNIDDFKVENRRGLGVSAEDILSANDFSKLRLEIVYTETTRPTPETIQALQQFLGDRINKPNGITITEKMIATPTNGPFSLDEIKDIEDEHRTQYTIDDDIALYMFFANSSSENDTDTSVTLGSAYQNTSIVVYKNTLVSFVSGSDNDALIAIETITCEHELGHLFGLVNIVNDDIHPSGHEDAENGKHCVIEDCLMYFSSASTRSAIETRMQNRNQNTIPVFDDLCLADLAAKGGKL